MLSGCISHATEPIATRIISREKRASGIRKTNPITFGILDAEVHLGVEIIVELKETHIRIRPGDLLSFIRGVIVDDEDFIGPIKGIEAASNLSLFVANSQDHREGLPGQGQRSAAAGSASAA